ncbi:MAG: hypothetical protein Q8Q06_01810 [bacterium]|nr:hypothetical protein [bacterium]
MQSTGGEAAADLAAKASATNLGVIGTLIEWAAKSFSQWLEPQNMGLAIGGVPVVQQSWTILRDFVNMLFILFLVIMAFGTIFDIPRYTYKDMLPNFLIAAFLINFSFTIGQYVISLGNGLAQVFLNQLGGAAGFPLKLAQGLQIDKTIPVPDTTDWILAFFGNGINVFVNWFFSLFFLLIAFLAFATAFIFTLVRVPVLWLFLIVSPVAWVSLVLPNTRQLWSKWWDGFLSWVFFLPVYLFFLMFGIGFINNASTILVTGGPVSAGSGLQIPVWGSSFIILLLTSFFLVGGLRYSFKVGGLAGWGAGTVMGKIQGGIRRTAYLPFRNRVEGTKQGAKAWVENRQEKGFGSAGYLGQQRARLKQAGFAESYGAPKGTFQRTEMTEVVKEQKKLTEKLNLMAPEERKGYLAQEMQKSTLTGKAALLEYSSQGHAQISDYVKSAGQYGENNMLVKQLFENIKKANMSDLFRSDQEALDIVRGKTAGTKTLKNLRLGVGEHLIEKGRSMTFRDFDEIKQMSEGSSRAEFNKLLSKVKVERLGTQKDLQQVLKTGEYEYVDDTGRKVSKKADDDLLIKIAELLTAEKKKGITDADMLNKAVATVGGKDTIEGQRMVREVNGYNPIIATEYELRADKDRLGKYEQPLSESEKEGMTQKIIGKIKGLEPKKFGQLSTEFFSNNMTQQIIKDIFEGKYEGQNLGVKWLSRELQGSNAKILQTLGDLAQKIQESARKERMMKQKEDKEESKKVKQGGKSDEELRAEIEREQKENYDEYYGS